MEGNTNEEEEMANPVAKDLLKTPVFTYETDKKDLFWMGGVAECFSSVLSLFGRTDLTATKGKMDFYVKPIICVHI